MIKILITGGTGTLGKALISDLYQNPSLEIHIFSRDENKQKALKLIYPNLKCHIGDVCDRDDLNRLKHHNFVYVYHCAAMKHVEICEAHTVKCIKINYDGTKNVYWSLGKNPNTKFCFFTTDKAVAPINTYGLSKALSEKFLLEMNEVNNNCYIFRWGNILGSTGSVIPIFVRQILNEVPITITDFEMTRFWLKIEDAVAFVIATLAAKTPGMHWPRSIKSAPLLSVVREISNILGIKEFNVETMGLRPGEKIHEAMVDSKFGPIVTSKTYQIFEPTDLNKALTQIVRKLEWELHAS